VYELCCFFGCVDVECVGELYWLVGDDVDVVFFDLFEFDDDVWCEECVYFVEFVVV